jgi:hypothetical protein
LGLVGEGGGTECQEQKPDQDPLKPELV